MYSKSIFIHFSKLTLFRPFICHRQVSPGFMDMRLYRGIIQHWMPLFDLYVFDVTELVNGNHQNDQARSAGSFCHFRINGLHFSNKF